jgi:hypothetical protein
MVGPAALARRKPLNQRRFSDIHGFVRRGNVDYRAVAPVGGQLPQLRTRDTPNPGIPDGVERGRFCFGWRTGFAAI